MKLQDFTEDIGAGVFTPDKMVFVYNRGKENENSPYGFLQMEFQRLLDSREALKSVVDYTEFKIVSPPNKEKFIVHLIDGKNSKEKIRQAIKDEKTEDKNKNQPSL
jgi:hypothetical protein